MHSRHISFGMEYMRLQWASTRINWNLMVLIELFIFHHIELKAHEIIVIWMKFSGNIKNSNKNIRNS